MATATKQTGKKPAAAALGGGQGGSKFDYARWRLAFRDPDQFRQYLEGYPDKTGLLGYVYRLKPQIDFGLIGVAETSILKTADTAEMNQEFLASRFGRGVYMLKLNDANRPKGQQEIARTWFKVDDPDLSPIYDPRTLVLSAADNIDEIGRLIQSGVLVRDAGTGLPRLKTEYGPPGSPGAPPAAVPPAVVLGEDSREDRSLMGQLALRLIDRAIPSMTPQTPADVLEQSFRIADRLHGEKNGAAPSIEQIADAVVLRLKPAAAADPVSMFKVYEDIEGFINRVRGAGNGGGNGAGSGNGAASGAVAWAEAVPRVMEGAVALVGQVTQILQMYRASNGAAAVSPGPRLLPALAGPSAGPGEIPRGSGPGTPAGLPVAGNGAAGGTSETGGAVTLNKIIEIVKLMIEKQAAGVSGEDFRGWLLAGWVEGGEAVYDAMCEKGVDGCMGFLAMFPDTSALVKDPARRAALHGWLVDFLPDEDDEEDDEGPAAVEQSTGAV